MSSLNKRETILIFLVVIVLLVGTFLNLGSRKVKAGEEAGEVEAIVKMEDGKESSNEEVLSEGGPIYVHISGQVNYPGLLKLKEGDRVFDAVELAGGLKEEADLNQINLARKLSDEEKIYIGKIGESPVEVFNQKDNSSTKVEKSGKIDINQASREELMTLPGIGEKTADKIMEYRKENLFKTIEDIKKVSGIGDKKFEAIKDLIMVR